MKQYHTITVYVWIGGRPTTTVRLWINACGRATNTPSVWVDWKVTTTLCVWVYGATITLCVWVDGRATTTVDAWKDGRFTTTVCVWVRVFVIIKLNNTWHIISIIITYNIYLFKEVCHLKAKSLLICLNIWEQQI